MTTEKLRGFVAWHPFCGEWGRVDHGHFWFDKHKAEKEVGCLKRLYGPNLDHSRWRVREVELRFVEEEKKKMENMIPWKKPEERPEVGRDCLILVPSIVGGMLFYIGRIAEESQQWLTTDDGEDVPFEVVYLWVYLDEALFPTPEWVKK